MRLILPIIVAGLVLLPSVVLAKTEFRLLQGDCTNGRRWWVVSEYHNGRLQAIHGMDCDGNEYHKPARRIVVPFDPTDGAAPTFTGTDDNGIEWFVVVRIENDVIVWQGGRDSEGIYWIWNASVDEEPGPGEDLN